jgi:hypothetical protein
VSDVFAFNHNLFCYQNKQNILNTMRSSILCNMFRTFLSAIIRYYHSNINILIYIVICRSQWPRGLRRRSTAARLLRYWVRIPPGAWMFICCVCCQVERSLRRADHSSKGSPTECGASLCVIKEPRVMRRP